MDQLPIDALPVAAIGRAVIAGFEGMVGSDEQIDLARPLVLLRAALAQSVVQLAGLIGAIDPVLDAIGAAGAGALSRGIRLRAVVDESTDDAAGRVSGENRLEAD